MLIAATERTVSTSRLSTLAAALLLAGLAPRPAAAQDAVTTPAVQVTGSRLLRAQGEDFGNTFTPAANAISLRGLGPNHTLTLVNGRRVADYPTAYDGEVNFVNLANIPSVLIERIEILDGGASAIYGSDAIAGVVN